MADEASRMRGQGAGGARRSQRGEPEERERVREERPLQATADEQQERGAEPVPGRQRRGWNRGLCLACLGAAGFLIFRDLSLPHVRDVEVWFGFEVRGEWARWTAPLHWALFGLAAFGFGRGRRWVWRLAPGYLGYVALSHLIWNWTSSGGGGIVDGLWQCGGFLAVGVGLWRLDRSLGK